MIEEEYIYINGRYIPLKEYHESIPEPLPPIKRGFKFKFKLTIKSLIDLAKSVVKDIKDHAKF